MLAVVSFLFSLFATLYTASPALAECASGSSQVSIPLCAPNFGIKVSGSKFVSTSDGHQIQLLGVSISGLEQGATALNTSPGNYSLAADPGFAAMASWNMNVVRIPLNAETWLGVNNCVIDSGSSSALQTNLKQMVTNANMAGLYVILDLHWTAPNAFVKPGHTGCPAGQPGMPDADNTMNFWTSIANTFKNNPAVMFELFNEPYGSNNGNNWTDNINGTAPSGQSAPDLNILLNGGTYNQFWYQCNWGCASGQSVGVIYSDTSLNPYSVTGTQTMVTAIRNTGAMNVIIAPTIGYDGQIQSWLGAQPTDPAGQLAAAWHEDGGGTSTASAADQILTAGYPVVITEAYHCTVGASQCVTSNETINGTQYSIIANGYLDASGTNVFQWAMTNKVGHVYWVWTAWPGAILQNTTSYAPNALGVTLNYAYCQQAKLNSLASCS